MTSTDGELIYSVTVPTSIDSFTVMEGLCETFLSEESGISSHMALVLRLSVAEACRNALTRDPIKGQLAVCTLSFLRQQRNKSRSLALEITDPGGGFQVRGKRPPYEAGLVGREIVVLSLLGQEIVADVTSEWSLELIGRDSDEPTHHGLTRETLLAGAGEYGLGLLALTRCWEVVRFTFKPDRGNVLRLEGPHLKE